MGETIIMMGETIIIVEETIIMVGETIIMVEETIIIVDETITPDVATFKLCHSITVIYAFAQGWKCKSTKSKGGSYG